MTQIGVPVAVVAIVVMLVVPLPPLVLDMLIAFNISAALLVLLTAMFVHRPLDFSWSPPCSGWRSTSAPPGWSCSTGTPAR